MNHSLAQTVIFSPQLIGNVIVESSTGRGFADGQASAG